jgi:hypothetical protein
MDQSCVTIKRQRLLIPGRAMTPTYLSAGQGDIFVQQQERSIMPAQQLFADTGTSQQ